MANECLFWPCSIKIPIMAKNAPVPGGLNLRRIMEVVKPYWRRVALAGVISLVISGLNTAMAWLVKPAMDGIFIKKDTRLLFLIPLAIFVIFILRGVFNFMYKYLMNSTGQKLVMNLRNRMFGHILDLPMGYFNSASSGSLISRVMNDTMAVQEIVSLTINQFIVEAATTVSLLAYAFWLRWDLTLIAVFALPSAFYGVGRIAKRLRAIGRRIQEKAAYITEDLSEAFTGVKIIKAFLREDTEKKRFTERNRDFYRENMRAIRVKESTSIIMELAGGIGIAFVLWYGGSLGVKGVITAGDFSSFITAMFLVYTPARRLSRVNAELQQVRAPLERIFELLDIEKEKGGNTAMPGFASHIEFRDVSFRYPGQRRYALRDISFTAQKGQMIALVGESGSGKTTMVNLLPLFNSPTEGAVYMDGRDVSAFTLHSLRSQFGMVSQEVILFNETVRANIAFGKPDAPEEEIISASKSAYAHEFINEFPEKYDSVIGEKGVRLSGGQRQRLSIARAILKNPPILILDEATSSLDTASEMMVQMALENLMKDRTTFVIAHRLSTIRKASRILVLEKGRMVSSGTHEELLKTSPVYRRLHDLQFSATA